MSTNENTAETTVTGELIAEPVIADYSDDKVLFTYVDLYDRLSHPTLFENTGRYNVVRVPDEDDDTNNADTDVLDTVEITGTVLTEALVDDTDLTGVEVTHLDLSDTKADTRQFTKPGLYKVVQTEPYSA